MPHEGRNKQRLDPVSLNEGALSKETKMLTQTKLALAALLVVSSVSTVLAESQNQTNHRASVVRRAAPPVMFEGRNAAVNPAAKPFTAEEQALFDRAKGNIW